MTRIGHAKIIPDTGRHRRLQELFRQQLAETPLVLQDLGRSVLWARALYNWQCRQEDPRLQEEWQDTKEFKHRLQVNWLRHCASNYEEILDALYEMKLDCRSKYILHNILKTTVLNLISDRYPEFREACKLQFRETTRTKSSRWRQAA